MKHCYYIYFGIIFSLLIQSCEYYLPEHIEEELAQIPGNIDYNFDVKPILSDRCFACHGPDALKREAGLRLDIESEAIKALESGTGRAIVPGNLNRSHMVHRILSEDADEMMPPPESNLSLDGRERAILIRWIEQGAEYKKHWAFEKPNKPQIPQTDTPWARNEIDHFISQKLTEHKIEASPEADRPQLIRRAFFDLTGLPPKLEDLDRWVNDPSADYYEQMVDSLLNLPAFGERMAAHWLDVSRFADSEGYLDDFHHTFWPYRDWVIRAFNENLPYDDFVLWQVGGDQIPHATRDQVLATAFNRHHKQNSEGGVIPEEFRVEYVADRTNTLGSAFMSLTVGCARCHDHKYDPFSQENYYQLFSFFNSTVERGDGIFSHNAIEYGQKVSNKLSMNSGPVLALPNEEVKATHNFLLAQIEKKADDIEQKKEDNKEGFTKWLDKKPKANLLKKVVEEATVSHLTFEDMANGTASDSRKGGKKGRYWGDIQPTEGKKGKGIQSAAHGQFAIEGIQAVFERIQPFTVSFWINSPKEFEEAHVLYNGNNRIQGYRGWDIMLDSNRVHFRLNHAHPYQSLDIFDSEKLQTNEWVHYVWTYDGSSEAKGMRLYKNGQAIKPEIAFDRLYRSTMPYTEMKGTVYMAYQGIVIGNRHYDQDFTGGKLDEIRVLDKEVDDHVAMYLYDEAHGKKAFGGSLKEKSSDLKAFYDLFIDTEIEKAKGDLRAIQAQEVATIDTVQEIMVMGDLETDRPTYILNRGVYTEHGKRVERAVPESILPWPKDLPKNRYGLGKWLTHSDHPLTARVFVNQMWYLMFGRGIVETVEDFGNQGALPTHPELLDWLAVDFVENGWNVKRLLRQMLTSATYRQSSKIRAELAEIDPDNFLLARGPRYRLSAEMIRDNALAASDLLNPTIGGPSTFPYQPDGLWKEVMTHTFFPEYQIDYEEGLYRRSIYTFWKRNMPPPSMLIFDVGGRSECQVRRQQSNTPLQALVLLNDPQIVEACRALAEQTLKEVQGDLSEAMIQTFRKLTSREPTEREAAIIQEQYQEEFSHFTNNPEEALAFLDVGYRPIAEQYAHGKLAALARVTQTIMNSTEAYYKN